LKDLIDRKYIFRKSEIFIRDVVHSAADPWSLQISCDDPITISPELKSSPFALA
jgi:hypothetical protein